MGHHTVRFITSTLLAFALLCPEVLGQANPRIFASVLPNHRTGEFGETLTYYAAVVNPGPDRIENCHFQNSHWAPPQLDHVLINWAPVDVSGQLIPHDTGVVFHIDPGETRYFVLSATAFDSGADGLGGSSFIGPENLQAMCRPQLGRADWIIAGGGAAFDITTHFISGRAPPDLIAVLASPSGDGILTINESTGRGVAAAAVINNGAAGEFIARADISGPAEAVLCRSDEAGQCLAPRTAEVTFTLENGEVALFSILARNESGRALPFRPDLRRLTLRFVESASVDLHHREQAGASTSMAVRQGEAPNTVGSPYGYWVNAEEMLALTGRGQFIEVSPLRWRGQGRFEPSSLNNLVGVFESVARPDSNNLILTGARSSGEVVSAVIRPDDVMESTLTTNEYIDLVFQRPFRGIAGWAGTFRVDTPGYSSGRVTILGDGSLTGEFVRDWNDTRTCHFTAYLHNGNTGGLTPEVASIHGVERNCPVTAAFAGIILSLGESELGVPERIYIETGEFQFTLQREVD
ncbi:hypothetical protein [Hyphobacterium sp.]|uniref:hypothetical protein n=1 Tax=Hyphobacterium sp. TaxID=2004662 RepID=UPI003BAB23E7